jgi:hypothetical protein
MRRVREPTDRPFGDLWLTRRSAHRGAGNHSDDQLAAVHAVLNGFALGSGCPRGTIDRRRTRPHRAQIDSPGGAPVDPGLGPRP